MLQLVSSTVKFRYCKCTLLCDQSLNYNCAQGMFSVLMCRGSDVAMQAECHCLHVSGGGGGSARMSSAFIDPNPLSSSLLFSTTYPPPTLLLCSGLSGDIVCTWFDRGPSVYCHGSPQRAFAAALLMGACSACRSCACSSRQKPSGEIMYWSEQAKPVPDDPPSTFAPNVPLRPEDPEAAGRNDIQEPGHWCFRA